MWWTVWVCSNRCGSTCSADQTVRSGKTLRVDLCAVPGQIWGDEDIKPNCELVRSVKRNFVTVDIVAYLLRYISS